MTPVFCSLVSAVSLFATAAQVPLEDRGRYAVTDIRKVDHDYYVQGEYAGSIRWLDAGLVSAGLQVVALGDGTFSARLTHQGLPGAGWDQRHWLELQGRRTGEHRTVLRADTFSLVVQDGYAWIYDPRGRVAGRLTRMDRISPTMGAAPPPGATILFGNGSINALEGAEVSEDGWLKAGTITEFPVSDSYIHLEFRTPYMPYARGQGRGNSGVYIQRRYEVQVLDSFGLEGAFNECGALYRQRPPALNMCFPPLTWQTYDIYFRAAQFDAAGNKTAHARITVLHNGVAVHDDVEIMSKTGNGRPEGPQPLPIQLQDHNNPVVFRNLWIAPLETALQPCW